MLVTATAVGPSDAIKLPVGVYVLQFNSSAAFVLDPQLGDDNGFCDLYDDQDTPAKITIDSSTGKQYTVVAGGSQFRMDVTTYNAPITMSVRRIDIPE